jgi:hypothetical protein
VSVGDFQDAGDGEFYDFKFYHESRGTIVYVDGDEVVREQEPANDIRLGRDTTHASDRCENCTALVACQRCIDDIEDVREMFDGGETA